MTVFLHVDMDAFYAAVEALDRPELSGLPIIIGADPKEGRGRGVVSTASYAARTFGVRSAMPIREAWKRCPHGVYLPPRMGRYAEVSRRIMAIFKEFTPLIQPLSVDEAFLDVTGSIRLFGDPRTLARSVKDRVRGVTGLTCSVGAAWVKSVAKIASDLEKPDGLTLVPEGTEREFLAPLEVRRLWGVGPRAAERLAEAGIYFAADIQARSKRELTALLGRAGGAHVWNMACGIDPREVRDDEREKSISHETTFFSDVDDPDTLDRTLLWLSEKVASRLRARGYKGRVVTVKYRTESFKTFTRRRTLSEPADDTDTLFDTARVLAGTLHRRGERVRLLGVGASALEQEGGLCKGRFSTASGGTGSPPARRSWTGSGPGSGARPSPGAGCSMEMRRRRMDRGMTERTEREHEGA